MRMLAVAAEERLPAFPDVPTFKELGYDLVGGAYRGVAVPYSTSEDMRQRISDIVSEINEQPDFVKKMEDGGFVLTDIPYERDGRFVAEKKEEYEAAPRPSASSANETAGKMELLGYFLDALTPFNLMLALAGVVLGTVIGALPGLSATMAVAVLVPFTFTMDPAAGLIALGAIYTGAIYGGSYAAILVNTPGTPSAIATTFDGFPMANAATAGSRSPSPPSPRWSAGSSGRSPSVPRPAACRGRAGLRTDGIFLARHLRADADRGAVGRATRSRA